MIKTKEMLSNENATLKVKIEQQEKEDIRIRTVLSELLGSYTIDRSPYDREITKKVTVQSWEGIAFMMGKLKADADYSNLLEANESLKTDINNLSTKLYDLENPKP